jgi:thiopurine S-methyltransferase
MEKKFWDEKWKERQIGFHQSKPHKQLEQFFEKQQNSFERNNVLVPLCGKSLDLIYLSKRFQKVIGVEFNKSAIQEFFTDNHLIIEEEGVISNMPFFRSGNITLVQGDIFKFTPGEKFEFIYDRAAIVALEPTTRTNYSNKLTSLCAPNGKILLISFEYDQSKISGPPFSVPDSAITQLFNKAFKICLIHEKSEKPKSPKFLEAKIEEFKQRTYLLDTTQ